MEEYNKIKKILALGFIHFLDENRPEGKMCLSNGECAEIEKAFNEQDWQKLTKYLDKYIVSEDERIRKALICHLKADKIDFVSNGVTKDECLAWLEKQKESLHIPEMCKENADSFTDNVIEVRSFLRGIEEGRRLEREKQKKRSIPLEESIKAIHPINYDIEASAYNYADQFADKGTNYIEIRDAYKAGAYYMELKQKEQKPPEWSEEDKKMLLSIINAFRNGTVSTIGQEQWLKSLPKRFNLQPKNEWSEEDERILKGIIGKIDHDQTYGVSKVEMLSFLKSLRPQPEAELTLLDENIINAAVAFVEQNDHFNCWRGIDKHTVIKALRSLKPHWKPSEEQMRALQVVVDEHWDVDGDALYSLYTDLKKLM